jgi:hypothetical protein
MRVVQGLCVCAASLAFLPFAVPRAAAADILPTRLSLVVVDGEGALNNLGQRANRDPAVRAEDENQKPIPNVAVVFTLPTSGASGEFRNGSKSVVVMTGEDGRAVAFGLKVNMVPGKLPIHVNASFRGLTARTTISQFSMSVPGRDARAGSSTRKILVILAIAGGAAAGGIVATQSGGRGSSSTPGGTPIPPALVITPGSGSIGPPR